jgi:uncharacterized protein
VLWVLAVVLVVVGLAGTVLPGVPGPLLVFAGLLLAAWADEFARVGLGTLTVLGLMTVVAYLVDLAATILGVRRAGASKRAVIGASIGLLAGLPFGLPGLLIGPFVGALAGELTVRGDLKVASRAGVAAWIGFLVGSLLKLAVVFAMLGLFFAMFFFSPEDVVPRTP